MRVGVASEYTSKGRVGNAGLWKLDGKIAGRAWVLAITWKSNLA
jgi:hypothetical protein